MLEQAHRPQLAPPTPGAAGASPLTARRPGASGPAGGMTRSQFERTLQREFLVGEIRTGTFEEQTHLLTRPRGVPHGRDLRRDQWHSWDPDSDPGTASDVYRAIVDGFYRLAKEFGGVPPVRRVLFFDMHYTIDQGSGDVQEDPDTGATYGGGVLTIYREVKRLEILPMGRSVAGGSGGGRRRARATPKLRTQGILAEKDGVRGLLPFNATEGVTRNIVHELGHGINEVMHRVDPHFLDQYGAAVGWRGRDLFDAGNPSVRITGRNWNDPSLVEQPMSQYMVVGGGPFEDFAEAIMAFVVEPEVLKARSPRRFAFLEGRMGILAPLLIPLRQVGDYPEPKPNRRAV